MSLIVWSGTRNCSCTQIWDQSIPSLAVRHQSVLKTARKRVSAWFGGAHLLLQYPIYLTVPIGSATQRRGYPWRSNDQSIHFPLGLPTYLLKITWQNDWTWISVWSPGSVPGFWDTTSNNESHLLQSVVILRWVPVTPHQSSTLVKVTRTAPFVRGTLQRQATCESLQFSGRRGQKPQGFR